LSSSTAITILSKGSPMGVDEIPVNARSGEERVTRIGENTEKE
jgi:hypothetical protein